MEMVENLYHVKATVLPAKIMVLLSKYALIIKEAEGIVINLSSLNVFKHVHNSYMKSSHPAVKKCYGYLLLEVNKNLVQGHMTKYSKNEAMKPVVSEPEFDERYQSAQFQRLMHRDSSVSIIRKD